MSKNEITQTLVKLQEQMGAYIATNTIDWNSKDLVTAILESPPPAEPHKSQRQRDVLTFAKQVAALTTTDCSNFIIELNMQRLLDADSTVSNAIIKTITRQYELIKNMKTSELYGYLISGGSHALVAAARPEYASDTRDGSLLLIKLDKAPNISS